MRTVDEAKFSEKRMEILKAARECFRRKGFHGASVSDICAAARMSPGHLYHYFASKEAIVEALVDAEMTRAAGVFVELADDANVVDALMAQLALRTKRDSGREPSMAVEMLAESARNKAVAAIVNRRDRARRALLADLLRKGQERGQVAPSLDADAAAAVVSRLMEVPGLQAIHDPTFDVQATIKLLQALLLRLLEPDARSAPTRRIKESRRRKPAGYARRAAAARSRDEKG